MLVLQFMEDLSDRKLERFIAKNIATKLFCDFSLSVKPQITACLVALDKASAPMI